MPNYSLNTHAPDQTDSRPRRLHWMLDLAALGRRYLNSEAFSWAFGAPAKPARWY